MVARAVFVASGSTLRRQARCYGPGAGSSAAQEAAFSRITISMHSRRLATCLAAATFCWPLAVDHAQEPRSFSVPELVAKNMEAKGGAEALHALQSLRAQGRLLVNGGQVQLAYAQMKKRPGEIRTEATLQGMTMVQAWDGTQGWQVSPFQGRKDPEKLSADEAKALIEDSDLDGPLVDWQAKGSRVEALGTEDVDGTAAYKLKVTRKNGDVLLVYLDPDHFLEIRTISQRTEHGAKVEIETNLGDYEKIGGVFVPFSIEAGVRGSTDRQQITLEKAEANVPLEDAVFHFPATAAK